MKFSVLLPTRGGGNLLNSCIRSVLESPWPDLELIIADNANVDNTAEVIDRWSTASRVVVTRSDKPIPVTENWQRALEASSGEYVLLIGDDDYVLPEYFTEMARLVEAHGRPDCITCNAYSFVFPASIGANRTSYYGDPHFGFGPEYEGHGSLPPEFRRRVVEDMFRFRVRFPLNMQMTLFARQAAARVPGPFFRPPFPDHFALASLLLTANGWLLTRAKLLIIGVSPKSFGHYVYSGQGAAGRKYLGGDWDFPGRVAGSDLVNGMHAWLEEIRGVFGSELAGVRIRRAAYLERQVYAWLQEYRMGYLSGRSLMTRFRSLSPGDKLRLARAVFDRQAWSRLARLLPSPDPEAGQLWPGLLPLSSVEDPQGFAAWLANRREAAASK